MPAVASVRFFGPSSSFFPVERVLSQRLVIRILTAALVSHCLLLCFLSAKLRTPNEVPLNPSTPELNPSAQRCLPRFLLGILIFKGLTARRLYKSFGVKGLITER
jgi:hypothetical protein